MAAIGGSSWMEWKGGGDEILAGRPVFSPNSRHMAVGEDGRKGWSSWTDWKVRSTKGLAGRPVFSPDSKRVAYAAKRGGKWGIVVEAWKGTNTTGYSKNGRLVFDSTTDLHTLAGRAGEFLRVNLSMVIPATKPSGTLQSKR